MLSTHVLATESHSGRWERKWHVISKSTFAKIWRKEENNNKFLGSQGHWKHWTGWISYFSLTKCLTSQLTLAHFREMPVDGGRDGTVAVAQSLVAGLQCNLFPLWWVRKQEGTGAPAERSVLHRTASSSPAGCASLTHTICWGRHTVACAVFGEEE